MSARLGGQRHPCRRTSQTIWKASFSTTRSAYAYDSPDDSLAKPLLHDLGLGSDGEDDGESQTVLTRIQTAQLLAQSRGQHRDGTLHQVDASSTLARIAVQSRVGFDEVRDIGNVHADVIRTILVDLDGQGIIEVLGCIRVDCEGTLSAEVLASLELVVGDAANDSATTTRSHITLDTPPRHGRQTLKDILAKLLSREVAILQKRARLDFNVTNGTELLDESAEGMKRADRLQIRGQSSFYTREGHIHDA